MISDEAAPGNVRHALILAAGRGSRFESDTADRPKPLIEFRGVPLILHVIRSAGLAGINNITVITGYLGGVLEECLARRVPAEIKVRCIENREWERPNGISVLKAKGFMPGRFALLMSDHFFDPRILRKLVSVPLQDGFCRLAVDFNPSGVPVLEDATKVLAINGKVLDIGKKIDRYNGIDTGLFLCSDGIFSALEASVFKGREGGLSDGIRELARQGKAESMDIGGLFWRDVDDEAGLLELKACVESGEAQGSC